MTSDSQIQKVLSRYGFSAGTALCEGIRSYTALLVRWNQKISLTTVTDPDRILAFHFGESLFAVEKVPIKFGRLADVGSGGGFPGIPLAMASPELEVTLVESNAKKSAFLSEVVRTLKLARVAVVKSRMEDLPPNSNGFEFVTARAVGHHEDLLSWSRKALIRDGKLVLWIGAPDATKISGDPTWLWRHPIPIPGSRDRVLLIGTPKV